MGDLNSIVDNTLDRKGNTRFFKQPSSLVNFLTNNLYIDTFRFLHPTSRTYTWSTTRVDIQISSRIDHIWVSDNWTRDIMYSSIENTDDVTNSDHHLATCLLHTGDIIRNFHVSSRRRRDKPRKIYNYKDTTQKDWDNYRDLSKTVFADDRLLMDLLSKQSPTQQDVDVIWKSIVHNTQHIASETIPFKVIKYRNPRKPRKLLDLRPTGLLAQANTLRKISNELGQFPPDSFIKAELDSFNNSIDSINTELDMDIPPIDISNIDTWPKICRPFLRLIKKQIKITALQAKDAAINEKLIKRAEDTVTNQSRMLSSILDREYNKIVIDRLVTTDENSVPTLHTNPDDILKLAPKQYSALLRPRQHQFDNMDDDWKNVYSPLQHFPDDIYSDLLTAPSFGEWQAAINKCFTNNRVICFTDDNLRLGLY